VKRAGRLAIAAVTACLGLVTVVIGLPLLVAGAGLVSGADTCTNGTPAASGDGTPTMLGPSTLTAAEMARWWNTTGRRQPDRLAAPIEDLITLYSDEGEAEGIRGDVAFAQAIHETGWFTNSDTAHNNFAGIAHYDGNRRGTGFADGQTGVRAHIQLLKKFAAGNEVEFTNPDVAPQAGAQATTWGELAGTWATDPEYWTKVSRIYSSMLTGAGRQGTSARSDPGCPPTGGPGGLVTVRGITVHASIATSVEALLADAQADGLELTGSGYRSHARQIELRRAHCGTSAYAIYEMPSSQCSPPTARPGTSMHEQGLAIDFDNCSSRSTACYRWLAANAARYGLYPLPSEPWHWSTSGQ
jgi:hypothetical protein